MPADKPFTVTNYVIVDRDATPPTVRLGGAQTRHKTESAARAAAKRWCDGGLNNGSRNLVVVEGPSVREVWRLGHRTTHQGRSVTIRSVPVLYTGPFAILTEKPADAVPMPIPGDDHAR